MKNLKKNELLFILGKKIREKRMELHLSQEQLAEICHLDRTYISLVERGKRNMSLNNLLKLASGLKTNISHLTQDI